MVCMQPWFTCSFGLHALCSLLHWVQFVKTKGKVQISSKLHAELQIAWDYYPRIPNFKEVRALTVKYRGFFTTFLRITFKLLLLKNPSFLEASLSKIRDAIA